MPTTRENLTTALEGGTPARTPLSIYDWNMPAVTIDQLATRMKDDAWRRLLDQGLGVTCHCAIVEGVEHGVETTIDQRQEDGRTLRIVRKRTPVGEIRRVSRGDWHVEDWIKRPADYRVVRWIVENTELRPRYERFARCEEVVGPCGVTLLMGSGNWLHRSPLMKICIDWAGTERFGIDLALEVPELFDLYAALRQQFLAEQRLIAAGLGRYVKWLENLTIGTIGPTRYAEYLMPVYREAVPILHDGGKRVMVHYDGQLRIVADQIATAPFDVVESLTEPPEGDMSYDECRRQWPDKVLWGNINLALHELPPSELRQAVIEKLARAGRRGFAFEISEALPQNWQQTVPVILQALSDEGRP
jgi:hypothetical protein